MGQSLPDIAAINIHLTQCLQNASLDVPVLPEAAQKVITLTQDPDSDAEQIANIIQSDPTLGGHVMRIANSAAYTPNSNLVSIQQAIARLGMVEITTIALSTSMNSKLFRAPGYEHHISDIWKHALASAFWSKETARAMRSNVEAAFLCGLLHSIGRPVILQCIADVNSESSAFSKDDLDAIYHQFECEYSESVAKSWGLPELVKDSICYRDDFTDDSASAEIAATVQFGCRLAEQMIRGDIQLESLLDAPELCLVNLYPDEIEKLIEKRATVESNMQSLAS